MMRDINPVLQVSTMYRCV